jgi:hypothetical protein
MKTVADIRALRNNVAEQSLLNRPLVTGGIRMSAALVIEYEPELAIFAVAAFNWFGLDAFSIERVSDATEILEGSNDIAVLLINDTEEGKELHLVKVVARRWPTIELALLSAHLDNLRDLPPFVFIAKPTTAKMIFAIVERVALAPPPDLNSPKQTSETIHS